ncbi:hypothetical protein LCGC14_2636380, partial [marine sediment metagenome]
PRAFGAPGGPAVEKTDASPPERLCPSDGVSVERVASVNDDVPPLQEWDQLIDEFIDGFACEHHEPDYLRRREFPDGLGNRVCEAEGAHP